MLSFNGHAAFNAQVCPSDCIYADLKAREGSDTRFALYYRGYLVWKDGDGWTLSLAQKADGRRYRQIGDARQGTFAFGFATRRETLEAIDRRHAAQS
jgi:hypothetical protein